MMMEDQAAGERPGQAPDAPTDFTATDRTATDRADHTAIDRADPTATDRADRDATDRADLTPTDFAPTEPISTEADVAPGPSGSATGRPASPRGGSVPRPRPRPHDKSGDGRVRQVAAALAARLRLPARWWGARPIAVRDREFALVFTVLSFAPPLSLIGARFGDLPVHGPSVAGALLTLGQTLPLALRTRRPAVCLTVTGTSFAVHECLGSPPTFGSLALYIALYSLGAHQARRRHVMPWAVTGGYVAFCVALSVLGSPDGVTDYLLYYVTLAAMWGIGALVRGWRAREAERRRLSAQAAVAEERRRMARELHDVVTHHVTAIVVQAGAAQYLTEGSDRLHEALDAINSTGRLALAELRFQLGVLEATGDPDSAERIPLPGRVPDLVEQIRASGQPVELVEDGEQAAVAVSTQLTAYRVVQESLTNAVKYAAGHRTLVRLAHTRHWTDVDVTTSGAADGAAATAAGTAKGTSVTSAAGSACGPSAGSTTPATGPTAGAAAGAPVSPVSTALRHGGPHVSGGRGLTGLRERVQMLGGEFAAGPLPEGGFRVHARIPTGGAA